ncbi:MAG TPA: AAC(3) family N-acetyltransferase [Armatimonadota bacterium]|nr:AAC(3) family N-acetyltransferase [Armatimonadota bacterium]
MHSSLRRLGPAEHGADGIIDALLAAVGSNGTVAVPTHTWGTVNELQPVFHPILSPSIVGALTNVFRQRPDALRSLHPTHSVAALGMRAEELVRGHELEDTPCSPTSPYGKLVTWGGKILFIGVGLQYCTFFHGCEEWAECPWLFKPAPEMYYSITAEGKVIPVPSRRHTHNVRRCYPILETPLREAGILQDGRVGECPLLLLDARRAAEWLVPRLRKNPYLLVEGGAINS